MPKPILIKPDAELWRRIRQAADAEETKPKPGPMVLVLLRRYFEMLEGEKNYGSDA